ncbi:MAG: hypothetical protein H0U74_10905 [Bradymonadaceae bacterium]|nr:hypothetical protein [Lujinxingiaceae bacterium]
MKIALLQRLGFVAAFLLLFGSCATPAPPDVGTQPAQSTTRVHSETSTRESGEQWRAASCGDEPDAQAPAFQPKICQRADAAATRYAVNPEDADVARFLEIWEQVFRPYYALTGLNAELRLVPAGVLEPTPAVICPGPRPVVYFSHGLVQRTLIDKAYPESFLAFVIGHELGHRINDFECNKYSAASMSGNKAVIEALADGRGAFFATIAGFSTRELATAEIVDEFLEMEAGVSAAVRGERHKELMSALGSYHLYEALYQLNLTLSLSASEQLAAATRLVDWVDDLLKVASVPIPEFRLLAAVTLMQAAITDAPWQDGPSSLNESARELRCIPVLATHSALQIDVAATDTSLSKPRSKGIAERRVAVQNLQRARQWLDEAEHQYGASTFIANNLRSCISFYMNEPRRGLSEHQQAMLAIEAVGAPGSAAVLDTLESNKALFEFAAFIVENPRSRTDSPEKAQAWLKNLNERPIDFARVPGLSNVITELNGEPLPAGAERAAMKVEGAPIFDSAIVPSLDLSQDLGRCPNATKSVGMIPALEEAKSSGTRYGVTLCEAQNAEARFMVSRIRLTSSDAPKQAEVRKDIVTLWPVDVTRQNFNARCPAMKRQAMTAVGTTVFAGKCEGFDDVVAYTDEDHLLRIDLIQQ